jgi:ribosomal protein S18 acetylase RimI-like enzyme
MASHRIELRDATKRDAAALAALNAASWRAAYAHMLPEAFLASLDVAAWEQRLRARFADAAQFTVVACAGRCRLGFVTAGPIRDEPPAQGGEIYALYVDPAHDGQGVGSALLEAAVTRLGDSGFSQASLWVFTRNANARRFYAQRGWLLGPHRWYWQRNGLRRQWVCYTKPLGACSGRFPSLAIGPEPSRGRLIR